MTRLLQRCGISSSPTGQGYGVAKACIINDDSQVSSACALFTRDDIGFVRV